MWRNWYLVYLCPRPETNKTLETIELDTLNPVRLISVSSVFLLILFLISLLGSNQREFSYWWRSKIPGFWLDDMFMEMALWLVEFWTLSWIFSALKRWKKCRGCREYCKLKVFSYPSSQIIKPWVGLDQCQKLVYFTKKCF